MAIGFAMAVPVGPVGLLCIRRTLNYGLVIGLLSGLGAALADALFAAAAAGGLASLMDFLLGIERQLRVAGGVFLVALGMIGKVVLLGRGLVALRRIDQRAALRRAEIGRAHV